MALVVVHGYDDIVSAFRGAEKDRVGWLWVGDVQSLGAGELDRGDDLLRLLVAEEPALAGVGIEAGDRNPGPCDAEGVAGFSGSGSCRAPARS